MSKPFVFVEELDEEEIEEVESFDFDEELEEEFADWEEKFDLIASPIKVKKMKKNFDR